MSLAVEIETEATPIGRESFENFELMCQQVGLELVTTNSAGDLRSPAFLVQMGKDPAETMDIDWPDLGFVGSPKDTLSLDYGVRGRTWSGDGLVFSIRYCGRGVADSLRFTLNADCFGLWYEEGTRDLILRAFVLLDQIRDRLPLKSAVCIDRRGSGECWLMLSESGWEIRPELAREASEANAIRILEAYLESQDPPISEYEQSSVLYRAKNHGLKALLRQNLVDGTQLPESEIDSRFHAVDEGTELSFLRRCWQASSGIDDIVSELGNPDHIFGPVNLPERRVLRGLLQPVRQQVSYEKIDDRFVVIFREYEAGRTTVTLAGKRRD